MHGDSSDPDKRSRGWGSMVKNMNGEVLVAGAGDTTRHASSALHAWRCAIVAYKSIHSSCNSVRFIANHIRKKKWMPWCFIFETWCNQSFLFLMPRYVIETVIRYLINCLAIHGAYIFFLKKKILKNVNWLTRYGWSACVVLNCSPYVLHFTSQQHSSLICPMSLAYGVWILRRAAVSSFLHRNTASWSWHYPDTGNRHAALSFLQQDAIF